MAKSSWKLNTSYDCRKAGIIGLGRSMASTAVRYGDMIRSRSGSLWCSVLAKGETQAARMSTGKCVGPTAVPVRALSSPLEREHSRIHIRKPRAHSDLSQ